MTRSVSHSFSPEQQLLLAACGPSYVQQIPSVADLNLEELKALAKRHFVVTQLLSFLQKQEGYEALSNYVRAEAITDATQSLHIRRELASLQQLFLTEGIEPLLIKGAALETLYYEGVGMRGVSDIDFLIHKKSALRLSEILLSNGYLPIDQKAEAHAATYFHSKKSIVIDVHSSLIERRFGIMSVEFETRFREVIILPGVVYRTLPAEETILFLLIHGAKHYFARLRWVNDIVRCLQVEQEFDESMLIKLSKGWEPTIGFASALVRILYDVSIPLVFKNFISEKSDRLANRYAQKIFQRGNYFRSLLENTSSSVSLRSRFSEKILFMYDRLF